MNDVQKEMSQVYKCQEKKRHTFFFSFQFFYKIVTIVRDVISMCVKVIKMVKKRKTNLIHFTNQSIRRRLKNKMRMNLDLPRKKRKEIMIISHLFFLLIYINRITRFSFLFNLQHTHQTKCHHASIKKNTKISMNTLY
jgi:hypothetical protein